MPSVKKYIDWLLPLTTNELIPNHCQGGSHPVLADIPTGKMWVIHNLHSEINKEFSIKYACYSLKISVELWKSVLYGTLTHQNFQIELDMAFICYLNNERKIDRYMLTN